MNIGDISGGFSIREYTLKMRSVNVEKCWPFRRGNLTKEDMLAMLPPMPFTKFRYWRDELEKEDPETKQQLQQPNKDMHEGRLKIVFNNSDDKCDDDKLNAHFDSCVNIAETSRKTPVKGKHRPIAKKRSLLAICAKSPQIENVGADNESDEARKSAASSSLKKKKDGIATKKRTRKELKLSSLRKNTKNERGSSSNSRPALEIVDAASSVKKKLTGKSLKKKCTRPPKLTAKTKKQNGKSPVRDILKNDTNVTEQSSSTVCNGPGSNAHGGLADKEQSAGALTELNLVENISEGHQISSQRGLYGGSSRIHSTLSEHHESNISTQAGSSAAGFSSSAGKLTCYSEDQAPYMAARRSPAGGNSYLQPSPSLFHSYESQNRGLSHLSQLPTDNIGERLMGHQSSFSPPSMQLMGNSSNHTDWKKRKLTIEEGYNHDNYFGLPLNSQGELIQLGSGGYSGNNHAENPSMVSGSSSAAHFQRSYLTSQTGNYQLEKTNWKGMMQKDQLNLFPIRSYAQENSTVDPSSILSLANAGTARRENTQPTMRLMGTDVTISDNKEMTYIEKGKSLVGNEVVSGYCYHHKTSLLGDIYHHPIQSQNGFFENSSSVQNISSHAGAENLREIAPRSGNLIIRDNPSSDQCFFNVLPPAPTMLDRAKNFGEQFGPGNVFLNASSQSFVGSSSFQDVRTISELNQRSVFDFPFLHPDHNGINFKQFWGQPTQHNRAFQHFPQPNSGIVGNSHPQPPYGIHISSGPELRHQAGASGAQNRMTSRMPVNSLPYPETAPHSPFVPILHSSNAASAPGHCSNTVGNSTRKRPAHGGDNSTVSHSNIRLSAATYRDNFPASHWSTIKFQR